METAYNKYFDLFDLAPIGYFRISEKGQIRQANLTGADLLAAERAYLEARLFSRFVAKHDQRVFAAHLKNTLETSGAKHCELRITAKDGAQRHVFMRSVPVDDGEGKKERPMIDAVWLIPLFPAAGFLFNGLIGRWYNVDKRVVGWVACSALGLSFLFSILVFLSLLKLAPDARAVVPDKVLFDWIVSGELKTVIGYKVDPLSIVMALVVSGVSFFIHIYSVGYMHDDPGFTRYFAYLNLFVFMMLTLVLANNFLLMFVGWEGVGLCSYLLIGF